MTQVANLVCQSDAPLTTSAMLALTAEMSTFSSLRWFFSKGRKKKYPKPNSAYYGFFNRFEKILPQFLAYSPVCLISLLKPQAAKCKFRFSLEIFYFAFPATHFIKGITHTGQRVEFFAGRPGRNGKSPAVATKARPYQLILISVCFATSSMLNDDRFDIFPRSRKTPPVCRW